MKQPLANPGVSDADLLYLERVLNEEFDLWYEDPMDASMLERVGRLQKWVQRQRGALKVQRAWARTVAKTTKAASRS